MGLGRFFQRKAKHPMLELARDPRKMRAASDALAEKKNALQTGMLSERKIRKLVQQLRRDTGSFSNTAAMLSQQGQLAEPALLGALSDPSFLGARPATESFLDEPPAATAIGLLTDCGTERCLATLRRFFHDEELRDDALRVFGTLCSAKDATELERVLRGLDKDGRKWVYLGIQNRFYEREAVDPLRSTLLEVLDQFTTAASGSPDFGALKCIGSIDPGALLAHLDAEEMLFGDKYRQRMTLNLLDEFHLQPSVCFHERLLTDPETEPNRDRALGVLANPKPTKLWLKTFERTLDRMEAGEDDVSTYTMEDAVARLFGVDHWTNLFSGSEPGDTTPTQRILDVLHELNGQVNNGGFSQYFFNQSGPNWQAALGACDEVGLAKIRGLLEQAVGVIGLADSDVSRDSIHDRLAKLTESQESTLNDLDSAYYKVNQTLSARSIRFIFKHRDQFVNR